MNKTQMLSFRQQPKPPAIADKNNLPSADHRVNQENFHAKIENTAVKMPHQQTKSVINSGEQAQLVSNLIWRQQTSMPVIKVMNFGINVPDYGYPKLYKITIETIIMGLKQYKITYLAQALYLIKNCLLGIQALSYKYNNFDFHHIYFGINEKGQCKSWISHDLFQFRVPSLPLPSQDIIIMTVLKFVHSLCNAQIKLQLNMLIKQMTMLGSRLNYTQINLKISQFAQLKKVKMINVLKINQKIAKNQQEDVSNKGLSSYKVNFRYYSPLSRHCSIQSKKPSNENKIVSSQFVGRPKVNWNYNACLEHKEKIVLNERKPPQFNFKVQQIKRQHLRHSKTQSCLHMQNKKAESSTEKQDKRQKSPVEQMLKSSQILKNKLRQSKNSLRQSIEIKQVYKLRSRKSSMYTSTQGEQTEQQEDRQIQQRWKACCIHSSSTNLFKKCSDNSSNTKYSTSNSFLSDKTTIFQNNDRQFAFKPNKNQSEIISNLEMGKINLGNYDFGGLLPLNSSSLLRSQIFRDQDAQNIMNDENLVLLKSLSRKKEYQAVLKSEHFQQQIDPQVDNQQTNFEIGKSRGRIIKNDDQFNRALDIGKNIDYNTEVWGWKNKVSRLFTEENSNLKQSLCDGEDIIQHHLDIQLEKLGKMGRQITSAFHQTSQ